MTDFRVFPAPVRAHRRRVGLVLASGALAALALAGCGSNAAPTPSSSATAGASGSSAKPSGSATPSAAPTPAATGTPVTLSCDQILTPEDVYAFNPNFGTAPDYTPAADSAAATAAKYDGVACAWSNQTSGDLIEVSVTQPNDVLKDKLTDTAIAGSHPVPTYGNAPEVEGFFTAAGGSGQAQVFKGGYWIVVSSKDFIEPGDPQQIISAVLTNLG